MSNIFRIALLATALFMVTFAVNLQSPLYGLYAAKSHMGATEVTIAFAAYVAGLMPTLILFGGLFDRIGRRLPMAFVLILGVIATVILVVMPNWHSLVIARIMLGIATALATTTATAYMREIMTADNDKTAILIVTSASSLSFGGGALATGVSLGLQGETTTPASFIILFIISPMLAFLIFKLPKTDVIKSIAMLRLPIFPSNTWIFGVAMALAWAATGMTIAIVPLELAAHGLGGWTGLVIFLAIFIGFLMQPIAHKMDNLKSLGLGFILIPCGFIILLGRIYYEMIFLVYYRQ